MLLIGGFRGKYFYIVPRTILVRYSEQADVQNTSSLFCLQTGKQGLSIQKRSPGKNVWICITCQNSARGVRLWKRGLIRLTFSFGILFCLVSKLLAGCSAWLF